MVSVDRLAFLQNVSLFSGMTPHELLHVAQITKDVNYPSGSTVVREGDIGDYMFVVVSGEVLVHRSHLEIRKLVSIDLFGEMSILDREFRSASVTAITNCQLIQIHQKEYWQLLISH